MAASGERAVWWAANRGYFARRARGHLDRREATFRTAMLDAIGAWLTEVADALRGHLTAAAPPGEPVAHPAGEVTTTLNAFTLADADAIAARMRGMADTFAGHLDAHVLPVYNRMLDEVLGAATRDERIGASLLDWRQQWLAARTQALVGVPDTITGIVRTALGSLAQRQGTSVDDAEVLVQGMLDRGYPQWAHRARTIARTEVVGATNQGSLTAWKELAGATGQRATKTWLATSDARTRPEHAELDGATVGIDEDFDGGLNGPGDESGDPGSVINCRCTLTYDFPDGEPADMPEGLTAASGVSRETFAADTPPAVQETITSGVAVMVGVGPGDEDAILSEPGVPVPDPPGLHCTVAYLAQDVTAYSDAQKASLLRALADAFPDGLAGVADAFALALFNPDSEERDPCAVVLVQSDWLRATHDEVADVLANQGLDVSQSFPIWIPHVAIGYNVGLDVVPDWLPGSEIQFTRLVVGWGDEQIVVAGDGAAALGGGADGAGDTGGEQLTAATEDAVTAPPAPLTDAAPAVTEPPAPDAGPAADLTPNGPTWRGPLAKLDTPSSDDRIISSTGGTIRTLPLPLWYQRENSHGGQPAGTTVSVGRVLACEVQGDVLWGMGDWDEDIPESREARAKVDDGMGMVSVDLSVPVIGWADANGQPIDPALVDDGTRVCEVALEWEFGGVTMVGFPAFDGVRIANDPVEQGAGTPIAVIPMDPGAYAAATPDPPTVADDGQSLTFPDGTTAALGDPIAYTDAGERKTGTLTGLDGEAGTATVTPEADADGTQPEPMVVPLTNLLPMADPATDEGGDAGMALLASSEVRPYTAAFFAKRDLPGPTPITVNPETGEVYGHLATWAEPHAGKLMEGKKVFAPHSKRDYSDFHLSPVLMDDGQLLDVGRITVGTGHAAPGLGHMSAVAHYDDSGAQAAIARAYEDGFGIQLCGQIIHDTPAARVEELMRSPLSGDWRVRDGNLELCAALAVNVPGFPVRRLSPVVGRTAAGRQLSLVAACMVEQAPRTVTRSVKLPSGATIEASDMEALVAASVEALQRNARAAAAGGEGEALAMRRARARLALL